MSDRYDDDLTDAEKTALDEQIVERDSGDPNSDREYLQDLPPADTEDESDMDADDDLVDTELIETEDAVEEGGALPEEEEGDVLFGEDDYGDGDEE